MQQGNGKTQDFFEIYIKTKINGIINIFRMIIDDSN